MDEKYFADKTAIIQEKVEIGEGTKIWQYSVVLSGSKIGKDCMIGFSCQIEGGAELGNGVKIKSNTVVWSGVKLENYVFIGPAVVFTNDIIPRAKYPKSKYPLYGGLFRTLVEEGASIGANATIVCGKTIGKWAMVGAGAVVAKDVPSHALVVGVPAKIIGWVCECGNKLEFIEDRSKCKICDRKYEKNGDKIIDIK